MTKRIIIAIVLIGLVFLIWMYFFSSTGYHRNESHRNVAMESIKKGNALAIKYCQSCHQLPDPSLLDAHTWEKGVLPNMGPRLGIFEYHYQDYPSYRGDGNLPTNFYPAKPLLSDEEWQNIIDYYTATSPDSLPGQNRNQKISMGLPLFSVIAPPVSYDAPAVSYVKIDTTNAQHQLIFADALKQNLFLFENNIKPKDSMMNCGSIVDINFQKQSLLLCDIGVLNPTNGKFGKVQEIQKNKNEKWLKDSNVLFKQLSRPVQISSGDLNGDGKIDYLVCEFGFLTGALCWMENKDSNEYIRHVIKSIPGAIKAYINDYNKDGKPDIWVLFAQGDEGISLFTNKSNGVFEEQKLITFPPVYGSSYFELADFNQDGHADIIYTCGDNADYSAILKPYHGIYIYLNDGNNRFKKNYFFPINGCYKAMARDFDGDGDLDIATISFFPDFLHQPEEGFVYLENKGNMRFLPYSLPETQKGRWLTMDAGDFNGDGKTDIMLGNFSVGPAMMKSGTDWKKGPAFMILQNTGVSHK